MSTNDKINSIKEYIDSIKEITIDELVEDNDCNDCYTLINDELVKCSYYMISDYIQLWYDDSYLGITEIHLARKSWMTDKQWGDNLIEFHKIKGYCKIVYPDKRDNNSL